MRPGRTALVPTLLLSVVLLGCSSPPSQRALPASPSPAPVASVQPTPAPRLAPAGPAPGGGPQEEEDASQRAVRYAQAVGCADVELQEHAASVHEQVTCRRGVNRLYIQTFTSTAAREESLGAGQSGALGSWLVVGPTWLVGADDQASARAVQQVLGGDVRPAG